jgi:NADH:ubiquinone oxidoreductase subunit 5 (subunit L)/multisubunit Na+/H+ antiporter MnhA subunit
MTDIPAFVSLIGLILLAAPLVYLGGHLGRRLGRPAVAYWLSLAALVVAWLPFGLAARQLALEGPASYVVGGLPLTFDGLSLLMAGVVLILGTVVVLFSGPYMAGETGRGQVLRHAARDHRRHYWVKLCGRSVQPLDLV